MRDEFFAFISKEHPMVRGAVMDTVRRNINKEPGMLESWIGELQADAGAFAFLHGSSTHGGWMNTPQMLRDSYITAAVFFDLLTLLENFCQKVGHQVSVRTHPTAVIRRAFFGHCEAKKYNMPYEVFYTQQFGAGLATGAIVQSVMRASVQKFGPFGQSPATGGFWSLFGRLLGGR